MLFSIASIILKITTISFDKINFRIKEIYIIFLTQANYILLQASLKFKFSTLGK